MYITVKTLKKTLGKFIEMTDLYIGIPMLFIFLTLFSFTNFKLESIVFLSICLFLMIPINMSKKNRMYKVMIMALAYLLKCKIFTWFK